MVACPQMALLSMVALSLFISLVDGTSSEDFLSRKLESSAVVCNHDDLDLHTCLDATELSLRIGDKCKQEPCMTAAEARKCCSKYVDHRFNDLSKHQRYGIVIGILILACGCPVCIGCMCQTFCCARRRK
mmetsp:Transcript_30304/g.45667  ORF Transcript_30304/g.45667 Transcript_30304/m.45667 type:complete len:130 (-) Transcript_30304:442-831(-)